MKISHIEISIEADARELRECNPLTSNILAIFNRCFQSREPFEDEEINEDLGEEADGNA